MSLPPADWYADPRDPASVRYWDGTAWTGHTQRKPGPTVQPTARPAFPPGPQATSQPQPQAAFQPAPQAAFQPAPQATFQPAPHATFQPAPQATFQPAPQATFQPTPQATFQPQPGRDALGGLMTTPGIGEPMNPDFGGMMTPAFGGSMTAGFGSRPGVSYASAPTARKRSGGGPWLGLGFAGVALILVVVAVVVVVLPKFARFSPDYTGSPVTSSDEASAGREIVISSSRAVAVEIPVQWRDIQAYADSESTFGTLPTGAAFVGSWFTKAPTSAASLPQMVMAMEVAPTASGLGTMDDIRRRYLDGLESSGSGLVLGSSQHYETPLGLEGDRTEVTFNEPDQGVAGTMAVVAVAHGRRFVLVIWVSFQGPIDEASFDAFMETLRIDA